MGQYLIDNNAISRYFAGTLSEKGMAFIDEIPIISVVTEIEALSWVSSDKRKEKVIQSFIKDSNVLPLSQDVIDKCVAIRRSRKIKTPDAIIAATTMVHELTLVTCDNDFSNIPHLKVLNPSEV